MDEQVEALAIQQLGKVPVFTCKIGPIRSTSLQLLFDFIVIVLKSCDTIWKYVSALVVTPKVTITEESCFHCFVLVCFLVSLTGSWRVPMFVVLVILIIVGSQEKPPVPGRGEDKWTQTHT